MNEFFSQLHFIRPLWLLLLLPLFALCIALLRAKTSSANWRRAIAPELIEHLLESSSEQRRRWPWLAFFAWSIATIALAGPTWEKLPQPVLQKRDGLVIVLDLSLSMYAEDIKPSRLQRARFKILDLLQHRREGLTGLVVYSGDAHVVTPLTDDTATIANLVPSLAPDMMPIYGSDAVAGIEQAIQLLHNSGFERGRIVLLSDEIAEADIDAIADRIGGGHWQLSLLGVGTEQGAPIATGDGFLKQRDGSIVIAQLHRDRFERLAQKSGGVYSDLRLDDKDIDTLLPPTLADARDTRTVQREFDQWRERGPWLAMLLLPFAAFSFRRGWLLIFFLLPFSPPSQAFEWNDLWKTADQQAQQKFAAGNAKNAAEQFRDPAWRAAAQYRAGAYEAAAQTLQNSDSAEAHYNRGNALARAGKLQEALSAYDAALKKDAYMDDAKANRALVEKLLQQQKQQSKNQQKDDQHKDGQQKEDQPKQSGSSDKSDGSGQQQNSDQQQASDSQQQDNNGTSSSDPKENANDKSAQKNNDRDTSMKNSQPSDQNKNTQQNSAEEKSNTGASDEPKDDKKPEGTAAQQTSNDTQSKEQQQQQRATEQWLRQIPDDPAGLLRNKFLYEHRQRAREAGTRDNRQQVW